MKIYTRKGDRGETSLLGGRRVPKNHIRIEAYGTVDELNSFTGMLRDSGIPDLFRDKLLIIQKKLFVIQSHLAAENHDDFKKLPKLKEDDITFLENEIDEMNSEIPELKSFIIPGGHITVSYSHVARTVCRRAERLVISLSQQAPVNDFIIQYINRLSDYFFVLARRLGKEYGVGEIPL
ncbi:MAG: cob(I)yrinic acid a,c-diamide adenosyltransferase [Bacteroidota bacterium]|nr:cob(I)yrinic acid a,c-diamide adenosyltransferase [Bacteroidota bacterium]